MTLDIVFGSLHLTVNEVHPFKGNATFFVSYRHETSSSLIIVLANAMSLILAGTSWAVTCCAYRTGPREQRTTEHTQSGLSPLAGSPPQSFTSMPSLSLSLCSCVCNFFLQCGRTP